MPVSRNQTANTLTSIYGNRDFSGSTIDSMTKAHVLQADPQGGVSETDLRTFLSLTRPEDYSTYPDPTGGLLRVSVLHKRENPVASADPRMNRLHMGIDLDDATRDPATFLKGLEGVWEVSAENADLAVGAHLLPSLRGYTHPFMVRKIDGWSEIDGYVWFHTSAPDPIVAGWIDTGVILPADSRPGVWGWAVRPR